ncbi:SCC1 / RAD21 FAMILY MEMBER [Salix koriyanagi]|uniref:SCC1 / RAD21 FAMILY MEMBER n=1 Tax=Salix koriyanagi TaxID=2511006 RepID=A0A9Q0P5I7_9ROSI|nr:SCC1 / RAD21 FAMILY MEMBER [Salix koriyanagi]
MVISTPAAKEHARVLMKRKCLFDDVVVFPNNVLKQCIEDTGDLVSKRRKLPHTAFAVWKACRFSNLDKCFLESLIPCTSLELGSLFRTKRLQIQETVKSVGGSVETVEPSINSDASESQNIGGSVETTERLEELNVSGSPLVGRLDETVELEENMLIQESAEIMEHPQKFESECPTSARFVEAVEPLDISPTAGGSLEQLAIAPERPIQCTTLLRSFENPKRPYIYDEDGQSSETVKKEICRNLDQELDLNLLNEDMNTSREIIGSTYGWSKRTGYYKGLQYSFNRCVNVRFLLQSSPFNLLDRVAVKCLHASFPIREENKTEEVLNLLQYTKASARRSLREESVSSSFPIGFLSRDHR